MPPALSRRLGHEPHFFPRYRLRASRLCCDPVAGFPYFVAAASMMVLAALPRWSRCIFLRIPAVGACGLAFTSTRSTFRSCSLMVAGADLQLAIPGTCAPDGLHTNRSTSSHTAPLKTRLYFGCLEHMDGGELHPSASACAVTIKSAHYIITPPRSRYLGHSIRKHFCATVASRGK